MKAAVLEKIGQIANTQVPLPQIKEDEVLIAVSLCGVCGSDYSIFKGKYNNPFPIIPGHEAIGVVEKTGAAVTRFVPGQRVVIHPNYACGGCDMCQKGLPNICRNKIRLGIDINGVFAEFVAVPEKALHAVPDSMPNEVAVFAEPLAVSAHGLNLTRPITPADRVLVFGAGVIGQLSLQLALQYTKHVTACDLYESRLQLAESLGAAETVADPQRLAALAGSFDIIYETSGADKALAETLKLAAPGATIIELGVPANPAPVSAEMIVRKELQIKGSMIYTNEIPQCIELLHKKAIRTEALISDVVSTQELQQVFDNYSDPKRMKTLVTTH